MGISPCGDLTPVRIEEYKARRLQAKSAHTINIEIRVLNTALNQAVQMGQINEKSVRAFKQIRTPSPEPPEWLRQEQIERLLTHRDPAFRRFVQVALQTGCRRNEILGLEWSDVDLARRQIVIRGSVGKMGKRRTIPISASLHELLVKWPGEHEGTPVSAILQVGCDFTEVPTLGHGSWTYQKGSACTPCALHSPAN